MVTGKVAFLYNATCRDKPRFSIIIIIIIIRFVKRQNVKRLPWRYRRKWQLIGKSHWCQQRKLQPSIARVNVQLDPQHAASKHTTAPINHTKPSPCKHSLDSATRARKQTSDYSVYHPRKDEIINNNNKQICIAPLGRNFRGVGARQRVSEQRKERA